MRLPCRFFKIPLRRQKRKADCLELTKLPEACMNGEQLIMNYARVNQTEGPTAEPPADELPMPHFDETALAVAQPVEPLPPDRFSLSQLLSQPFVIVVAFAMVFAVAVAASALVFRTEQTSANPALAPNEQPSQAEAAELDKLADALGPDSVAAPAASETDDRSRAHRVFKQSRPHKRSNHTNKSGRPVARKVGEIRYGRGQN